VKVSELRKILKRTGASIIEANDAATSVPKHSYRLCTGDEILQAVADTMKTFLLDAYGNEYKPDEPKKTKFSAVILGTEYFEDKADIKVRFARKKLLVFDCDDPPSDRHQRRFKLRVVVFGESPKWGPRRMWKNADCDNDEAPF
jgi:hypothetical protein